VEVSPTLWPSSLTSKKIELREKQMGTCFED
jgi:hypothetical protein